MRDRFDNFGRDGHDDYADTHLERIGALLVALAAIVVVAILVVWW
jgi:hypothetical protein